MKILVTGAGATNGTALVKSLRGRGHDVLAADPSPHAPGRQLAASSVTSPWANDPDAVRAFFAAHTDVDLGVLQITSEIPVARSVGIPLWACSDEAIADCEDKLRFAGKCLLNDIPHPTTLSAPPAVDGDWFVKPRMGEGSRNTFRVRTAASAKALMAEFGEVEPMICQPALVGREWEVDVFADEGYLLGGVAFWKDRMKGGTTVSAETFALTDIWDLVEKVTRAFDLDGPLNIGGFWDDPTGQHWIVEVNPRFSHGYLIAEAAGGNPIEFFTRWATGQHAHPDAFLDCRAGVRFERYWTHAVSPAGI